MEGKIVFSGIEITNTEKHIGYEVFAKNLENDKDEDVKIQIIKDMVYEALISVNMYAKNIDRDVYIAGNTIEYDEDDPDNKDGICRDTFNCLKANLKERLIGKQITNFSSIVDKKNIL